MGRAIGIDLGTTYSAIAVLGDTGQPEILPNRDGEASTPSVVLFQAFDGRDEPLVGTMAKHSAAGAVDDVVQFVKRFVGDPAFRFDSTSGSSYSAVEVSAIILKRLKEDAELALGEAVTEAVITVPAYFDDAWRTATKQAGKIAGLNVLRVLNEPTAAALSFGLHTEATGNVLVFDLGGGTFDVTLMRIDSGEFDVLGTDGDRNLGGFDFDNRLIEYIAAEVEKQGGPSLLETSEGVAGLREKAEMAKRSLTSVVKTNVHIAADTKPYRVQIERAEFEKMTADLLRRTEDLANSVLEEAGTTWPEIDHVVLVGGSTRMPMVPALVQRLAGKRPTREINPDEAVALGAAIQAGLTQEAGGRGAEMEILVGRPIVISDVTSQSLGVISVDNDMVTEVNTVIIPRNSKIPAKMASRFSTVVDYQEAVKIRVTQGDNVDPQFVVIVGEKELKLPLYPRGASVEIMYAYDIDQTIFVEVFDCTANQSMGSFEIDRLANMNSEEVRIAKQKISNISVT